MANNKYKEKLEQEKSLLEKELEGFAKKDSKVKGDWDSDFPNYNTGVGSQQLEEEADEVEEYVNRLPVEQNMELRLKKINNALDKIKKGTYGKCLKCGKAISKEKLSAYPEAEFCKKCQK